MKRLFITIIASISLDSVKPRLWGLGSPGVACMTSPNLPRNWTWDIRYKGTNYEGTKKYLIYSLPLTAMELCQAWSLLPPFSFSCRSSSLSLSLAEVSTEQSVNFKLSWIPVPVPWGWKKKSKKWLVHLRDCPQLPKVRLDMKRGIHYVEIGCNIIRYTSISVWRKKNISEPISFS